MKKFIYSVLILGVLSGTTACRKYVEIQPEQLRVLKLTTDYQGLLYNSTVMDLAYYYPVFSGDDIGSDDLRWQTPLAVIPANAYTWAEKMYIPTDEDPDWGNNYKEIFICNLVARGVLSSEGGTDTQKQAVLASALVHRAFAYFTLVNIYGKPYDAATAATDPGVPLVMEPNFTADLTRASVQKIYDQITADLTNAIPSLPDLPDFTSNPSKAAAYAILARVELNKRNFAEAERYANLALSLKSTLIDLSLLEAPVIMPTRIQNPEEILIKRTSALPVAFPLSASAVNVFTANAASANDLRYKFFTVEGSTIPGTTFTTRGFYRQRLDGAYVGPSVPEMMLIKAECEARAGHTDVATSVLNDLRKKRFKAADYFPLTAADAKTALLLTIDERKREFLARGFRWFDQRRLSKDPGLVSTVTRVFRGVTYTLEPGSNRYTYPIADKYIQLNPEIIQNPR
jgi:hypothetical protein